MAGIGEAGPRGAPGRPGKRILSRPAAFAATLRSRSSRASRTAADCRKRERATTTQAHAEPSH
eukprot:scaffold184562_cov31-Tisochrysis_lutea.AAC.4